MQQKDPTERDTHPMPAPAADMTHGTTPSPMPTTAPTASSPEPSGTGMKPCKAPTLFSAGAGPFCPYNKPKKGNCAASEHCCIPMAKSDPSFCAASCDAEMKPIAHDFACDAASHCGAGEICCAKGTIKVDSCGAFAPASEFAGSVCVAAAACPAETPVQLCGKGTTECAAGATCTPFAVTGKSVGYCK
jgi:hypothetical protein